MAEGWIFTGWHADESCSADSLWDFDTRAVTGDMTLYAGWIKLHTVTFNLNGLAGTAPDPAKSDADGRIATPTAPTAICALFGGWYKDAACTTAWDFAADVVTEDMMLYAKWQESDLVLTRGDGNPLTAADCSYADGVMTITGAGPYTLRMRSGVSTTSDRVVVTSGSGLNLTLDGVKIDSTNAAFRIAGSAGAVTLTLSGENSLKSGTYCAGLQKESTTLLTITFAESSPATVTGISVSSSAHKTEYTIGDNLDVTNLTILVTKSDGTTETVQVAEDMVSGFDSTEAADALTLTIRYNGAETTYSVRINALPPTITGVLVTPAEAIVQKGATMQFSAAVSGTGDYETSVTWSVEGASSTGTSISADGLLSVDAKETATSLTVKAVAKGDSTKLGTAAVGVTDAPVVRYSLNVIGGTGGSEYASGENITITADAPADDQCHFVRWTTEDGGILADASSPNTTYTMPGNKATVTANFAAHDLVHHEAKTATCTEIGWESYDACTRCDYTTYAEIGALGHDLADDAAVPATCTVGGKAAGKHCTRCDHTEGGAVIEKLGHDTVHHEAKAATCTGIGWEAYDTCTRCDYTTYAEISPMGHSFCKSWTYNKTRHWHECAVCQVEKDTGLHSYTNTTDARCDVCGYTRLTKTPEQIAECLAQGKAEDGVMTDRIGNPRPYAVSSFDTYEELPLDENGDPIDPNVHPALIARTLVIEALPDEIAGEEVDSQRNLHLSAKLLEALVKRGYTHIRFKMPGIMLEWAILDMPWEGNIIRIAPMLPEELSAKEDKALKEQQILSKLWRVRITSVIEGELVDTTCEIPACKPTST